MPELPEVETARRGISPWVEGARLNSVTIRNPALRWPVPVRQMHALAGLEVARVTRRAKYLLLEFPHKAVLLHLGMSGSLTVLDPGTPPGKHDHIDFHFTGGRGDYLLRLTDPRRFGCALVLEAPFEQHKLLRTLGPEPLDADFSGDTLFKASRKRKLAVKNLIMDGKVVVGVGNIYASEALYMAGIRPGMAAGRVSRLRYEKLVDAIKAVLQDAIKAGGTTLADFRRVDGSAGYFRHELQVYGRDGEPCYQCGSAIRSRVLGQRNTFYCPTCQS